MSGPSVHSYGPRAAACRIWALSAEIIAQRPESILRARLWGVPAQRRVRPMLFFGRQSPACRIWVPWAVLRAAGLRSTIWVILLAARRELATNGWWHFSKSQPGKWRDWERWALDTALDTPLTQQRPSSALLH